MCAERTGRYFETEITDLAFDGKAVGSIEGKIVFLNAGLPGEKVRAEIVRKKPRYNFGRVIDILEKSPDRIKAPCIHFDICGGCTWQDLDYSRQLFFKRKQVIDCLKHIGRIDNVEIAEVIGCSDQFYYRNKMEFSLNKSGNSDFVLGLHHRGHFDRIFDVKQCLLQSETSNSIVAWFRAFIRRKNIPVYDVSDHSGFVRYLVIREGKRTGQIMLNIVTTEGTVPDEQVLVEEIRKEFPAITTIVQNINSSQSNIARGESDRVLYGPGYIEEKILGYTFRIYANSFFQTNSIQVEKLYQTAIELLEPRHDDHLLDLYCGAGTIGICTSGMVADILGVEQELAAIIAAKENALNNNISNIHFVTGAAEKLLATSNELLRGLNVVMVDPPRAGMHPKALEALIKLDHKRIVYVSCNPATFARDASALVEAGYSISQVVPVDMFPHTMHIELVAGFQKLAKSCIAQEE